MIVTGEFGDDCLQSTFVLDENIVLDMRKLTASVGKI